MGLPWEDLPPALQQSIAPAVGAPVSYDLYGNPRYARPAAPLPAAPAASPVAPWEQQGASPAPGGPATAVDPSAILDPDRIPVGLRQSVQPTFDPLAGMQPQSFSGGAAEEPAAPAAQPRPTGLAGMLEAMSPAQRAALASRMITVGGSGGGGSMSTTTKRTPQLPGFASKLSDLELQGREATLQKGEAEAQQAKAEALAYRGFHTAAQAHQDAYDAQQRAAEARVAEQDARYASVRSEVAAMKVDPDRWWGTRSGGQKAALGIAAALSGFVQAFQHQGGPNPVIAMINQNIDRDVEIQKANIAKRGAEAETERGVLRDLYGRLGDMRQAEVQYRIMQSEALGTKLKEISVTAQEPIARANAAAAATSLSQQVLQLKNVSYALEQGETAVHKTRTAGGGGQRMSALQALQGQALQQQQLDTAMAESRLKGEKAKRELGGLDAPAGKKELEGTPVETIRKSNVARDALQRLWTESKGIWMGKRELSGLSPFGSTWKSRLEKTLVPEAAEQLSKVTGRSKEEWQKSLLAKWDNADDIRQRILDADAAISSEVSTSLDVNASKYNVKPLGDYERRRQLRLRLLLQGK